MNDSSSSPNVASLYVLAGNLRRLREDCRMTQEELAHMSRLPLQRLQAIEAAHESPRVNEAIRLARSLGVTLYELLRATRPLKAVHFCMGTKTPHEP